MAPRKWRVHNAPYKCSISSPNVDPMGVEGQKKRVDQQLLAVGYRVRPESGCACCVHYGGGLSTYNSSGYSPGIVKYLPGGSVKPWSSSLRCIIDSRNHMSQFLWSLWTHSAEIQQRQTLPSFRTIVRAFPNKAIHPDSPFPTRANKQRRGNRRDPETTDH